MPRKVFTAGEILTAADVNTNLMDQSVMVFAGSAARGSAIPSPTEGMVTYRSDDDLVEVFDGSVFKPIGTVLQVINASHSSSALNDTTTFADTGLTATITPSSTSSKVLVFVSQNGVAKESANVSNSVKLRLLRDATSLLQFEGQAGITDSNQFNNIGSATTFFLDSPNTTSAVTYKTQFANIVAALRARVQNNATSTIVLMEIAG